MCDSDIRNPQLVSESKCRFHGFIDNSCCYCFGRVKLKNKKINKKKRSEKYNGSIKVVWFNITVNRTQLCESFAYNIVRLFFFPEMQERKINIVAQI